VWTGPQDTECDIVQLRGTWSGNLLPLYLHCCIICDYKTKFGILAPFFIPRPARGLGLKTALGGGPPLARQSSRHRVAPGATSPRATYLLDRLLRLVGEDNFPPVGPATDRGRAVPALQSPRAPPSPARRRPGRLPPGMGRRGFPH